MLKRLCSLLLATTLVIAAAAQEGGKATDVVPPDPEATDTSHVHAVVGILPEFPGGMDALRRYLSNSIRYPREEQDNGIQGRVYIEFVVDREGKVGDVVVKRGVPGGPGLEREAVRVVSRMPRWSPGMHNGKPVKTLYALPIGFVLQENDD